MGYESWNHSRFLLHKLRNMSRRGWLLKTYNDGKLLCGRIKTSHISENDEIDILHPVGYVAHVKSEEKCEVFTQDIQGDTSRRVITNVIGNREHHPPPDENEMWIYAPTEKKQFLRIKKKREQQSGGGGGGAQSRNGGGGGGGGGGGQQQGRQTKESGREPGIHQDGLEEKITSTTKSSYANKGEKGIGHESGGNFTVKSANSNQFEAQQKFMSKASEHHRDSSSGHEYVGALLHARDHIAGGNTSVSPASAPSSHAMAMARMARANGNHGYYLKADGNSGFVAADGDHGFAPFDGSSGGGQQQQEQPGMQIPEEDGSHNWSAEGKKGNTSLLQTAAKVGTLGAMMGPIMQMFQNQNQKNEEQSGQQDDEMRKLLQELEELKKRLAELENQEVGEDGWQGA